MDKTSVRILYFLFITFLFTLLIDSSNRQFYDINDDNNNNNNSDNSNNDKILGCFRILQTLEKFNQLKGYLCYKCCSFGYCNI